MTFRWYGKEQDSISLQNISQIPGMKGVVGALFDVPVGESWPLEKIRALKKEIEDQGLLFETVESVNIHEDIKLGLTSREKYIENYITSLKHLGQAGVKVVCYNFMPVFDWTRTDLTKVLGDGSTALDFDIRVIRGKNPQQLVKEMQENSNGFELPGWEDWRLKELQHLFELYKEIDEEKLFDHLHYFLKAVIPTAEEYGIKMAIHPDDPPFSVFGLPRIVTSKKNLKRIVDMVDSPSNCLTICSGSLGANLENNIPEIIRYFGDRVAFGHVRNVQVYEAGIFNETAHKSDEGSLDLYEIMKAFHDIGFTGPIRPDHGRMIWGEKGRPGYGLYDRALGANYLCGLWDAISRNDEK